MLEIKVGPIKEMKVRDLFYNKGEIQAEPELDQLLAGLSPDAPWGARQAVARKIGYTRDPAALPALCTALPVDRFWMVRCEIIQALERIADPAALPALSEVAENDSFKVVRQYAARAVDRLS